MTISESNREKLAALAAKVFEEAALDESEVARLLEIIAGNDGFMRAMVQFCRALCDIQQLGGHC